MEGVLELDELNDPPDPDKFRKQSGYDDIDVIHTVSSVIEHVVVTGEAGPGHLSPDAGWNPEMVVLRARGREDRQIGEHSSGMHCSRLEPALRLVGKIKLSPVSSGEPWPMPDDLILIISARTCAHGGWLMSDVHLTRACTARPVRVALLSSLNK